MSIALRTAVVGAAFFASYAAQAQMPPSDHGPLKVGTRVWVAPMASNVFEKGTILEDRTGQNAYVVRTDTLPGVVEMEFTVPSKNVDELKDECKPPRGQMRPGVPKC